jgi:hypothetical protein
LIYSACSFQENFFNILGCLMIHFRLGLSSDSRILPLQGSD